MQKGGRSSPGSYNFCTQLFRRQVSATGLIWPWKARKALSLRLGEVTEMFELLRKNQGQPSCRGALALRDGGRVLGTGGESPARSDLQCPLISGVLISSGVSPCWGGNAWTGRGERKTFLASADPGGRGSYALAGEGTRSPLPKSVQEVSPRCC